MTHNIIFMIHLCMSMCADDGSSLQFECAEMKVLDMIAEINKKARTLSK